MTTLVKPVSSMVLDYPVNILRCILIIIHLLPFSKVSCSVHHILDTFLPITHKAYTDLDFNKKWIQYKFEKEDTFWNMIPWTNNEINFILLGFVCYAVLYLCYITKRTGIMSHLGEEDDVNSIFGTEISQFDSLIRWKRSRGYLPEIKEI